MRGSALVTIIVVTLLATSCSDPGKVSVEKARAHAQFLAETVTKDVDEVRSGLPAGAEVVGAWWKSQALDTDPKAAQDSLEAARRKVQVLRMAKSTFFA